MAPRISRVQNIGAGFQQGTSITASGSTLIESFRSLLPVGPGPLAISSNVGNGIGWGLGQRRRGRTASDSHHPPATVLVGFAASATGQDVVSLGVTVGNSSQPADSITSPPAGVPLGSPDWAGRSVPVRVRLFPGWRTACLSTVSTTTGDIVLLAAAGSTSGTLPSSSFARVDGLDLNTTTVQTDTTWRRANQLPAAAPSRL